jgi:hypothetical protein
MIVTCSSAPNSFSSPPYEETTCNEYRQRNQTRFFFFLERRRRRRTAYIDCVLENAKFKISYPSTI